MTLADELAAITASPSRRCGLSAWLETLTDAEAAAVRAAIADDSGKKPQRKVAEAITKHGYPISAGTISSHRRNECLTCRS